MGSGSISSLHVSSVLRCYQGKEKDAEGLHAQRNVDNNKLPKILAGQVAKWFLKDKTCLLSIMRIILAHLFFK